MNKIEALNAWSACKTVDGNPSQQETHQFAEDNGYTNVEILSVGCDEVVVYYDDTRILVVVGGSSFDSAEWWGNIEAYKTINGCHKGYYEAAEGISRAIDRLYIYRGRDIEYRGHSRGGAIVQVIRAEFHNKGSVITFGSPKPFTRKKSKTLDFNHTCFIAKGDFVPLNPFVWFPPGWKIYSSTLIKLPRLKWRMEHINYGIIIRKYYR